MGVHSGPNAERIDSLDNEHPEFPENLAHAYDVESKRNMSLKIDNPDLIGDVFADFEVCSLEPGTPGAMQAACIESAKNIFVAASKREYK